MNNIQAAEAVMMVRPVSFGFNDQTAGSNSFQNQPNLSNPLNEVVNQEFDNLVQKLREKEIEVVLFEDSLTPAKPDAVFCNNWISFHHDGTVIFYPMMAANRRIERRRDVVETLQKKDFVIHRLLDYSKFEETDKFLESTGSMVIDYVHKIIYACLSPRTDPDVLNVVAQQLGMDVETYTATDREGKKIYHTNVNMAIGDGFAIICEDSIPDNSEKLRIMNRLSSTGHEIIRISYEQLYAFAGNMLQLKNKRGNTYLVMSETAYRSLSQDQVHTIENHTEILRAAIPTIEKYGGGSVRCMIANLHLPKGSH